MNPSVSQSMMLIKPKKMETTLKGHPNSRACCEVGQASVISATQFHLPPCPVYFPWSLTGDFFLRVLSSKPHIHKSLSQGLFPRGLHLKVREQVLEIQANVKHVDNQKAGTRSAAGQLLCCPSSGTGQCAPGLEPEMASRSG